MYMLHSLFGELWRARDAQHHLAASLLLCFGSILAFDCDSRHQFDQINLVRIMHWLEVYRPLSAVTDTYMASADTHHINSSSMSLICFIAQACGQPLQSNRSCLCRHTQ